MTEVTAGQVKGLFFHLVKSVGGVEAAGAYLNISHQRVSALQNANTSDMPTIMQVVALERAVGQDIVTGALSRAVTGKTAAGPILDEAMDAVDATVGVMADIRAGKPKAAIRQALIRAEAELHDVGAALDAA